jgi:hypothetical protein
MNLFTVGTRRDSDKWPNRDRRKDLLKYDIINFDLLNPYIIGKIIEGTERMKELLEKASKEQEYVSYKGLNIKRLLIKTCTKYYEIAIKIYIGQELIKRISDEKDFEKIKSLFKYDPELYSEKWVDAAGMYISKKEYDHLIKSISGNNIKDLTTLNKELQKFNKNYVSARWAWCAKLIENRFKCKIDEISKDQLIQIITDWRDNSIKLNNMILKDAEKEFDQASKIGFGLDGDEEVRVNDFENVRGKYDENKFVKEIRKESEKIIANSESMINLINS